MIDETKEKTWTRLAASEIIRRSLLEQAGEPASMYESIFGPAKPPAAAITEVEAREVVDALAQYETAVERLRQLGFVRAEVKS